MAKSAHKFLSIGLCTLSILPASAVQAAPTYNAMAEIHAQNFDSTVPTPVTFSALYSSLQNTIPQQYVFSSTLAEAAVAGTEYASGLDSSFNPATTTIDYAAMAQASLGDGLKAQASITGSNFFWNSENTPYVNADNSVNVGGMPILYGAGSWAGLIDTLNVAGDPGLASIKFIFDVSGALTASGSSAAAFVTLLSSPTASTDTQVNFYAGTNVEGSPFLVDQQVTSDFFNVIGGEVFLDLRLVTSVAFGDLAVQSLTNPTGFAPDATAQSDFFSTVTIANILGYDSSGRQVSLFSVKGSDGTVLPVGSPASGAVPEPSTWATMILGFGLIGGALRRRARPFAASA